MVPELIVCSSHPGGKRDWTVMMLLRYLSAPVGRAFSDLGKGSEGWALTICLWSPQNMFGMWKPVVFLALAAVALYVLPNMRPQETEFCLME